jgi:mannose-1-phosphate guanylyltransferase
MIQATVERVLPIIPIENIFVATNRAYGSIVKRQVPMMPAGNIIEEPSGKNTAPCIGLGAMHIRRLAPETVMASLHADHFIANEEAFRQALLAAEEVAGEGYLVTLGIVPDKPETGYGYIQRGAKLGRYNNYDVYEVARFLEKPRLATASQFAASGRHYWNSGIFVWQISTLMAALAEHLPQLYAQLNQIEQAAGNPAHIEAIWEQIQKVSIDVGIMEHAQKVAVIPINVGWNDVGSWAAIHDINRHDPNDNVILSPPDNVMTLRTKGALIESSGKFIAVIGLEDVIIIEAEDAILVCAKDRAQDVKEVVGWLEETQRTDLV